MKTRFKTLLAFLFLAPILSCQDDESCAIDKVCLDNTKPNSEFCNWSVVTSYGQDGGTVAQIFQTRSTLTAPKHGRWRLSGLPDPIVGPNWTSRQIGDIFGIAIDSQNNVYFASSDIYYYSFIKYPSRTPIDSSNPKRPFSATTIFIAQPGNFEAVPLVELPSISPKDQPFIGIGNIAYDKWNNQLFASNLEDGKIYRIDLVTHTILDSYDPWKPDSGQIGIEPEAELVWCVGVNLESNKVKLYFPKDNLGNSELYSITLNEDGSFPPNGSEHFERQGLSQTGSTITDLAFSQDHTGLLLAERGAPFSSQVNGLKRSSFLGWNGELKTYFVGNYATKSSDFSSGGIDFANWSNDIEIERCDELFWATTNFYQIFDGYFPYSSFISGLQGIETSGNALTRPSSGNIDIFIDFDKDYNYENSPYATGNMFMGDVEVFDCNECIKDCE